MIMLPFSGIKPKPKPFIVFHAPLPPADPSAGQSIVIPQLSEAQRLPTDPDMILKRAQWLAAAIMAASNRGDTAATIRLLGEHEELARHKAALLGEVRTILRHRDVLRAYPEIQTHPLTQAQ